MWIIKPIFGISYFNQLKNNVNFEASIYEWFILFVNRQSEIFYPIKAKSHPLIDSYHFAVIVYKKQWTVNAKSCKKGLVFCSFLIEDIRRFFFAWSIPLNYLIDDEEVFYIYCVVVCCSVCVCKWGSRKEIFFRRLFA